MDKLKAMTRWVCWKYETVKGKKTKVPYSPKTHQKCGSSPEYENAWVSYDEAIAGMATLDADGVELVIPKGYGALDRDHMSDDDPIVAEVRKLIPSYAETSPSGQGMHIIFKVDPVKVPNIDGKWDYSNFYVNNAGIGLELYLGDYTNHMISFTGNVINDVPVNECTDGVVEVMKKFMVKTKADIAVSQIGDGEYLYLDDIELLPKMLSGKKGDVLKALHEGDITKYGSHSEADLAYLSAAAFYTGGDRERMDELYRSSGLYRDKWERDDYRENTITKAIEGCKGVFYTGKPKRPSFVYVDDKGIEHISCPLLARFFRDNVAMISVRDSGRGGVQRYVYENGQYVPYADEMVKGLIKKFITDYNEFLLKMRDVNEVFQQLITDLNFVTSDMLNADEGLINFKNGLLHIEDLSISNHEPDLLSTIQLPCEWTGVQKATPVFDSFIDKLTDGDKEVQELLLEFMGTCISNVKGWRMKKALFMVGPGDTGKSQLKALTELLLGKGNFVAIDLGEIEARFGTGNIYGKRLAGSSDMSFMSVDELKVFKKCTGGDSLFAEFKGQNGFEFTYDGLLWFCMNKLPKFGGDDGEWVYNRIMQVECKNVIPPDMQDKQLLDKLYAEREGIIYRAVMALKRLIDRGYRFIEPEVIKAARITYKNENNTVISFFEDCMVERPGGKIKDQCTTGRVYKVYREWCKDNNHGFAKTAKEFREELAAHLGTAYKDLIVRRGSGGSYFKDYTVSEEVKENYRKVYGYDDDISTIFSTED